MPLRFLRWQWQTIAGASADMNISTRPSKNRVSRPINDDLSYPFNVWKAPMKSSIGFTA
jgi:hypothetical protein